jgi:8-oxo-dGTP diphosphatase
MNGADDAGASPNAEAAAPARQRPARREEPAPRLRLTTLAFVRRGAYTLMLDRSARPGLPPGARWNGLGGKFLAGESPEACLRREVYEEAGIEVEEAQLKGLLTFPAFDGSVDVYSFVYLVTRFHGEPFAEGPEGRLHWIATERVAELPLWEGDRTFLPWLERPGFFSAELRYVDGRFVGWDACFYASEASLS